jgi:hypothetical protein
MTFIRRFTENNLRGLLLMNKKIKFVNLSNHYMSLKQAPKQWHEKINKVMLSNKFKINKINKYIYVKNANNGYVILYLYMKDMFILDSNDHMIKSTKKNVN